MEGLTTDLEAGIPPTGRCILGGCYMEYIYTIDAWKIQCKLPPKTKRFCPLVLK